MAIRVSRLLKKANIGMQSLIEIIKALGFEHYSYDISTKIPDEIANQVLALCCGDFDFLELIEQIEKKGHPSNQQNTNVPLKIIGQIDLDAIDKSGRVEKATLYSQENGEKAVDEKSVLEIPLYDESNKCFWVEELWLLSSQGKAYRLPIGSFNMLGAVTLYSLLIGCNGVGKSSLLKEIVDFFIDLHANINDTRPKSASANKARLRGVKYHIDGVCCEVIRFEKTFIAKINGRISILRNLRLPLIVACNFGAFDKFPVQRVNGSSQTRYDVPYYKYVGAHVNGNMISSSAIAFRLLFALNEQMDERERMNISSTLDFIGYDHKISLYYSMVLKARSNDNVRSKILQLVRKDREYANLSANEINSKVQELYAFYKQKVATQIVRYCYVIDFDRKDFVADDELKKIYKLKQYELINSTSVLFYKQGEQIASEHMSSGEFAMLATILCISTAATDSHSLILIDEPELSLHPNWQMTFIDNLDRALNNRSCHLMIATHSHMLVSDLPMNRSSVSQWKKGDDGMIVADQIAGNTYGWSAEEVLLKVFKTATDRNRYFGERIAKLLERMGDNAIGVQEVADELKDLKEISLHLSDVDPMKMVLNTIIEAYN